MHFLPDFRCLSPALKQMKPYLPELQVHRWSEFQHSSGWHPHIYQRLVHQTSWFLFLQHQEHQTLMQPKWSWIHHMLPHQMSLQPWYQSHSVFQLKREQYKNVENKVGFVNWIQLQIEWSNKALTTAIFSVCQCNFRHCNSFFQIHNQPSRLENIWVSVAAGVQIPDGVGIPIYSPGGCSTCCSSCALVCRFALSKVAAWKSTLKMKAVILIWKKLASLQTSVYYNLKAGPYFFKDSESLTVDLKFTDGQNSCILQIHTHISAIDWWIKCYGPCFSSTKSSRHWYSQSKAGSIIFCLIKWVSNHDVKVTQSFSWKGVTVLLHSWSEPCKYLLIEQVKAVSKLHTTAIFSVCDCHSRHIGVSQKVHNQPSRLKNIWVSVAAGVLIPDWVGIPIHSPGGCSTPSSCCTLVCRFAQGNVVSWKRRILVSLFLSTQIPVRQEQ